MIRGVILAGWLCLCPAFGWAQGNAPNTPAALYDLAEQYRTGNGVLQSYSRAAELYADAAKAGHHGALSSLGGLMMQGLGIEQDQATAFELLKAAAQSGEGDHLFSLAVAHQNGLGTELNLPRAAELFEAAVQAGSLNAAIALGTMYQGGLGVTRDTKKAMELYSAPANAGHARALNNLGLIHARGEDVAQDYEKARILFEAAAEKGLREALKNLAALYANGFGVEVNEDYANELLRLAGQGTTDGSAASFTMLHDPRLAAPDESLIETYTTGANAGDPVALYLLGMVLATKAESAKEFRAVARAFSQAAEKGLPAAMANLGILSFQGQGVLQDYVEGYMWLTLAAAAGLEGAIQTRDQFLQVMTAEQINAANDLANERWSAESDQDQN